MKMMSRGRTRSEFLCFFPPPDDEEEVRKRKENSFPFEKKTRERCFFLQKKEWNPNLVFSLFL